MDLQFFTIVNNAYLPKASALARSIARIHPKAKFHLVLADKLDSSLLELANFSGSVTQIIELKDLPLDVPNRTAWYFRHNVVELATAIKAQSFLTLFEKTGAKKLVYLDPDIWVLDALHDLSARLNKNQILLTPHQLEPEERVDAIWDNEVCSLKHGIYNLGFLALRWGKHSETFLKWWNRRLMHFCFNQPTAGLFTDQRWIDLAPVLFESVEILLDPAYNVATWNLTHRQVTKIKGRTCVNGKPLRFYHFSGFDSGAQGIMLKRYGVGNPELFRLREAYIEELEECGQSALGKSPWLFDFYSDGAPVTQLARRAYRELPGLQEQFPNPYSVEKSGHSFKKWFELSIQFLELTRRGDPQLSNAVNQALNAKATPQTATRPASRLEKGANA